MQKQNQLKGSNQPPDVQSHSTGADEACIHGQQTLPAPSTSDIGAQGVWDLQVMPRGDEVNAV